jgi:hypothetical protein
MAAPVGPKKVKRYSDEFKIQAVKLARMGTGKLRVTLSLVVSSAVGRSSSPGTRQPDKPPARCEEG